MHEELIHSILWAVTAVVAVVLLTGAALARRRGRRVKTWIVGAGAAVLGALVIVPAIGVVPAGHRGVIYEWNGGVDRAERGEGITLLLPWVQTMKPVSVRTQKVFSPKVFSQSRDLQEITVEASVNYHVDPARAAELYQEVGLDYATVVVQPALFQRTKAAIGKVLAEDFALGRENLAEKVQAKLVAQLDKYGIVVEFVNIEDAIFDKQFIAAVKAKIIAEQKAAEERRLIEAEAAIKEQTIIKAEAEARAVRVKADADAYANDVLDRSITNELLRWRWINTWNGQTPTTILSDDAKALLGIYP